jgi:hypothetical protein
MLSTCMRTLAGLMRIARAASRLVSPRLMWRSTSISRSDSSASRLGIDGAVARAAAMTASTARRSKRPAAGLRRQQVAAAASPCAGRQGRGEVSAVKAAAAARMRSCMPIASPRALRK